MRKLLVVFVLLVAGCKGKKAPPATGSNAASGSGVAVASGSAAASGMKCPSGNVIKDGACIVAITPEKIAAVTQQQSKLDELATLLDKVDQVATPIEMLNAVRQTPEWAGLTSKLPKLKAIETTVETLDGAVKQLRTFKGNLGEASARLGNLKGELDRIMTDPGNAKQLAEVRSRISSELRSTFEPLGTQFSDTIQKAVTPLAKELEDLGDLLVGTCVIAKQSGGDKVKELCGQAKDMFAKANTYIADLKTRPAKLFDEVSTQLETQLALLIDDEAKQLLDAAQAKVNGALALPPAGSGSGGSGSAAASGSATP